MDESVPSTTPEFYVPRKPIIRENADSKKVRIVHDHYVKRVQIRSFFWFVFSCIRIEYGDLVRKSPYSVRIQENTNQKKLRIWTLFMQ